MRYSSQFCPVVLAKKLDKLGVNSRPVMWWRNDYPNNPGKYEDKWYVSEWCYTYAPKPVKFDAGWHLLPAWSVAELGQIMRNLKDFDEPLPHMGADAWYYYEGETACRAGNEAEARARLLIHYLSNPHKH